MSKHQEEFLMAISNSGLTPPDKIIADGVPHRFVSEAGSNKKNGWYILHLAKKPCGIFGCWKNIPEYKLWFPERHSGKLKPSDYEKYKTEIKLLQEQWALEKVLVQDRSSKIAEDEWDGAEEPSSHAYLDKKEVGSYGLKLQGDRLLIPLRDKQDKLWSLQKILPDGEKKFLPGGKVDGCFHLFGKEPEKNLCVAEGYATAATIHEATGYAVAVAFNVGNLLPVSKELREKYPETQLLICADDDWKTEGNPGLTKAKVAAEEIMGSLAVPTFPSNRGEKDTDFNDLFHLVGSDAVKADIEKSIRTERHDGDEKKLIWTNLADVEAKPVEWLWKDRIALGKLCLLAGNPGQGKSLITSYMASVVSRGGNWPVEDKASPMGSVIFLSAEDDDADTLKPRLLAHGADIEMITTVNSVVERQMSMSFSLEKDVDLLEKRVKEIGDVAMIIIDPITAYLGNVDSNSNSGVRGLLEPLRMLASQQNLAILLVAHLNKAQGTDAMMRVSGSTSWVAAVRTAYLVTPDKEDKQRRMMLPIKNNLGIDDTGFAYHISEKQLDSGIVSPVIKWEKELCNINPDDAVNGIEPGINKLDEACEFLNEELSSGSVSVTSIKEHADKLGISDKTLKRAKNKLGIGSKKQSDGTWAWVAVA